MGDNVRGGVGDNVRGGVGDGWMCAAWYIVQRH